MYYHIRLDKICHDGSIDMNARIGWDFLSLGKALAMIGCEFGADAACWRIQDVTDGTLDVMRLENELKKSLESMYQFIVMTFKDDVSATEKYDHYEFFIAMRDETECPPEFSFSEKKEEAAIIAPEIVFEPNVRQSIDKVLQAFGCLFKSDFVDRAIAAIIDSYCNEEDVPRDIIAMRSKRPLSTGDCIILADECQDCCEEELAAMLYAAGYYADGTVEQKGNALVKLAELCNNSNILQYRQLEFDTMDLVEILSEAQILGYEEPIRLLAERHKRFFEDFADELDVDDLLDQNYDGSFLCFAAFCLCKGIGWEKDVPAATRLYEAALAKDYPRAAYYLKEIHTINRVYV